VNDYKTSKALIDIFYDILLIVDIFSDFKIINLIKMAYENFFFFMRWLFDML